MKQIQKIFFWKPVIGDSTLNPTVTPPCNEYTQNILFIINSKNGLVEYADKQTQVVPKTAKLRRNIAPERIHYIRIFRTLSNI